MNIDDVQSIIGITERKSDAFTSEWWLTLRMLLLDLEKCGSTAAFPTSIPASSSGRTPYSVEGGYRNRVMAVWYLKAYTAEDYESPPL
jgi:hypothetical protein